MSIVERRGAQYVEDRLPNLGSPETWYLRAKSGEPVNRLLYKRLSSGFNQRSGCRAWRRNQYVIDPLDRRCGCKSAGGLDAFEVYWGSRIDESRCGRSFLSHLDPSSNRCCTNCDNEETDMEVVRLTEVVEKLKTDRSYVCPPQTSARFKQTGSVRLCKRLTRGRQPNVIDISCIKHRRRRRATRGGRYQTFIEKAGGTVLTARLTAKKPSTTSPIPGFAPYGI